MLEVSIPGFTEVIPVALNVTSYGIVINFASAAAFTPFPPEILIIGCSI